MVRPAGHARGSLPEWPGNNSFAFPGNLKIIYCCRLSAGCGAGGRLHVICYTMLVAPQTLSTSWCGLTSGNLRWGALALGVHPSTLRTAQPRSPVVCFWCCAKRDGDRTGFAPLLKKTHCWHSASRGVRSGFPLLLSGPTGSARDLVPEWPGNNSFAFPENLKTIYYCRLSASCGAGRWSEPEYQGQLGGRQGAARRRTCGFSLWYLGNFARGRLPEFWDPKVWHFGSSISGSLKGTWVLNWTDPFWLNQVR